MRLHLINDLPLFGILPGIEDDDHAVGLAVDRLRPSAPARIGFLSFGQVMRWWEGHELQGQEFAVLVGTRPSALQRRRPLSLRTSHVLPVRPARQHNERGETAAVDVADLPESLATADRVTVCVIDDVLMSGLTMASVLASIRRRLPRSRLTAAVYAANQHSVAALTQRFPDLTTRARVLLDYRPIFDGTVIFLWDLLYGTLRGQPFLDQTPLLRPLFGTDQTTLLSLRDHVEALRTSTTNTRDTHGCHQNP